MYNSTLDKPLASLSCFIMGSQNKLGLSGNSVNFSKIMLKLKSMTLIVSIKMCHYNGPQIET